MALHLHARDAVLGLSEPACCRFVETVDQLTPAHVLSIIRIIGKDSMQHNVTLILVAQTEA